MDQKTFKELKRTIKEQKKEQKQAIKKQKQEQKQKKKNAANSQKPLKTILDCFPVRDYRDSFFILKDGTILDVFQIQGKSLLRASDDEIESKIHELTLFFRGYDADFKLISMNYPSNTSEQQNFLRKKLENASQIHRQMLEEKLYTLSFLEEHCTDRETYFFLFAKDDAEYLDRKEKLFSTKALQFCELSQEKKCNIISSLNNQHKKVKQIEG